MKMFQTFLVFVISYRNFTIVLLGLVFLFSLYLLIKRGKNDEIITNEELTEEKNGGEDVANNLPLLGSGNEQPSSNLKNVTTSTGRHTRII